jgi:hypothetical protein
MRSNRRTRPHIRLQLLQSYRAVDVRRYSPLHRVTPRVCPRAHLQTAPLIVTFLGSVTLFLNVFVAMVEAIESIGRLLS